MPNIGARATRTDVLVSAEGCRVLFATTVDEFLRIANLPSGSMDAMISGPIMAAKPRFCNRPKNREVYPMVKFGFHFGDAVTGSPSPRPAGLLKKPVSRVETVRTTELLNQSSAP